MSFLKQLQNKTLSELSTRRIGKAVVRRLRDLPHRIQWNLPLSETIDNKEKISLFKDLHKGKRCFVVANGPSLKLTDLSLLKREITIGMNRIYLMKEVNGFIPTYLVVADIDIQLRQFAQEYDAVNLQRFYHWNSRHLFRKSDNLVFFKESFNPEFQPDLTKEIGTGKSVAYSCLQIAYYMGFKEVILIGKDHSYNVSGTPHISLTSNGNEDNHFIKGYFKPGMKWDIPDYTGEEFAYALARKAYENDGRRILDATIGGHLGVFPKTDYSRLF